MWRWIECGDGIGGGKSRSGMALIGRPIKKCPGAYLYLRESSSKLKFNFEYSMKMGFEARIPKMWGHARSINM